MIKINKASFDTAQKKTALVASHIPREQSCYNPMQEQSRFPLYLEINILCISNSISTIELMRFFFG